MRVHINRNLFYVPCRRYNKASYRLENIFILRFVLQKLKVIQLQRHKDDIKLQVDQKV